MTDAKKFRYRSPTALDIRLRLLKFAISNDTYSRVLVSLSKAAASRIDEVERDAPEEIVDDECDVIESLLGAASVMCQVPITEVTQRALRICELMSESSRLFAAKREVRALGPQFDRQFSKVEVLWALGNYFKHREEWKVLKVKGPAKETIPVLEALGVQESSSGSLRAGAAALGNAGFNELSVFEDVMRDWAEDVHEAIRKAIGV